MGLSPGLVIRTDHKRRIIAEAADPLSARKGRDAHCFAMVWSDDVIDIFACRMFDVADGLPAHRQDHSPSR